MKEDQKKMRLAVEKRYDSLQQESTDIKLKLEEATAAKNLLQTDFDELTGQFKELEQQLSEEKNSKGQLEAKSEDLLKVIQQLQKELEDQKTAKTDLEGQFAKVKADYDELKTKHEGTPKDKGTASKSVQLEKIVLRSHGGIKGKVLSVNKQYDFVVIDLGQQDGISKGMIFDVYRGKKQIGKVQIETVRKSISAAAVMKDWTTGRLVAGDTVQLI